MTAPLRSCVLNAMGTGSSSVDGWSAYNYGRATGRAVLRGVSHSSSARRGLGRAAR